MLPVRVSPQPTFQHKGSLLTHHAILMKKAVRKLPSPAVISNVILSEGEKLFGKRIIFLFYLQPLNVCMVPEIEPFKWECFLWAITSFILGCTDCLVSETCSNCWQSYTEIQALAQQDTEFRALRMHLKSLMIVSYWGERWAKSDFNKDSHRICSVLLPQAETWVTFPLDTAASGGWWSKIEWVFTSHLRGKPIVTSGKSCCFKKKERNKKHVDLVHCNLENLQRTGPTVSQIQATLAVH